MDFFKHIFKRHAPVALSILVVLVFAGLIKIFAAGPFAPGTQLDPNCLPTDAGCTVNIFPDQTGNGGKFLKTDGSAISWDTAGGGGSQWDNVTGGINYAGGKVGIGTTAPGAGLDIQVPLTANAGSANGVNIQQTLTAFNDGDALNALVISPTFSDGSFTTDKHNALITAYGAGNVGLGLSAPRTQLEVLGDIISKGNLWTSSSIPVSDFWTSIAYGDGTFVAVAKTGSGDRVMTSPDGINWTSRTSAADNHWNSVTYGNGLFVAVSDNGFPNQVMTSPDGITWTLQTNPNSHQWNGVAYGNGTFVAVSGDDDSNGVMTSADGKTWTTQTAPVANGWSAITYGNGLFVTVSFDAPSSSRVMTSPDGVTWTAQTAPTKFWSSVAYGNGIFVAVSIDGFNNQVMTSPDGMNWTSRTDIGTNAWGSVTYGNGLFVAVAHSGSGRVMSSPDGINWALRGSAVESSGWNAVAYGNGTFASLAANGSGNRAMSSGKEESSVVPAHNIFQGLTINGDETINGNLTVNGTCTGCGGGGGLSVQSFTFTLAQDGSSATVNGGPVTPVNSGNDYTVTVPTSHQLKLLTINGFAGTGTLDYCDSIDAGCPNGSFLESGPFNVGDEVDGQTSGAKAIIISDNGDAFTVYWLSGIFTTGEVIQDQANSNTVNLDSSFPPSIGSPQRSIGTSDGTVNTGVDGDTGGGVTNVALGLTIGTKGWTAVANNITPTSFDIVFTKKAAGGIPISGTFYAEE